ncbi:MAG: hypothetical protein ACLPN6_02170 [Streptosporangiaceae bacterium]|jgi:hypothetical protein|nr:hypothetical protein [Actinomycetota bacterium]
MSQLEARDIASHARGARGIVLAAAITAALGLGACSSSGTSSAPSSHPVSSSTASTGSATFHGVIYVDGAAQIKKSYTDQVKATSCATAAQKGDAPGGGFQVPSPTASPDPQVDVLLAHFTGPGIYKPDALRQDKGNVIWLTGKSGMDKYVLVPMSSTGRNQEGLMLNKDGSGEFVFADAHLNGSASSPAISGLVSWTCSS